MHHIHTSTTRTNHAYRPHTSLLTYPTPPFISDVCHSIIVGWQKDYPNESAFIMPKCLDDLIAKGHYGRKTGQGFYKWEGDKKL